MIQEDTEDLTGHYVLLIPGSELRVSSAYEDPIINRLARIVLRLALVNFIIILIFRLVVTIFALVYKEDVGVVLFFFFLNILIVGAVFYIGVVGVKTKNKSCCSNGLADPKALCGCGYLQWFTGITGFFCGVQFASILMNLLSPKIHVVVLLFDFFFFLLSFAQVWYSGKLLNALGNTETDTQDEQTVADGVFSDGL